MNYPPVDAYDSLFAKCENIGTPGTFLDSSTANPKTITANGGATQLPIKFNKSAGFFNGTTDWVNVPSPTVIGTNAFTYEFFFNTSTPAQTSVLVTTRAGTATTGFSIYLTSSTLNFILGDSVALTGVSTTITGNVWHHVMVIGNGGANGARTIKMYLDGAQEGNTLINDYNLTDAVCNIGVLGYATTYYYSGWVKELRMSNVARTVTVPTTQYSSDANTVLLMHFDTPATSPLGPALEFTGAAGSYLTVTHSAPQVIGTNDFEMDFYFRYLVGGVNHSIYSKNFTSTGGMLLQTNTDATPKLSFYFEGNARITSSTGATLNVWNHYNIKRVSGVVTMKQNGVSVGTYSGTDNYSTTADAILGVASTAYANGYIKNFSLTITSTKVLDIKFDENNGASTIVDSSSSPKTLTLTGSVIKYLEDYRSCLFTDETGKLPYPQGSAKVDFFAVGSGVGYFPASGNLTVPSSPDFAFGTGDFSVEGYFRWYTTAGTQYLIYKPNAASGISWGMILDPNFSFYTEGSTTAASATFSKLANTWYHLAITRHGTDAKIFINGTQAGTTGTDSTNIIEAAAKTLYISVTGADFLGIADNIRISKGVARYTATFNPPEEPGTGGGDVGSFFMMFL